MSLEDAWRRLLRLRIAMHCTRILYPAQLSDAADSSSSSSINNNNNNNSNNNDDANSTLSSNPTSDTIFSITM